METWCRSKFKNLRHAIVYIFVQIYDKISCIQIRETLTLSTDADRSTHTIYWDMFFNQKCPGYSNLGIILFEEKMQEFYFNFAIIGQLMYTPSDRKSQWHLSKLLLDFNILFNCLIITLIDLQRDGVTNKCFMYMATFFIKINFSQIIEIVASFFWYWICYMLNISIFRGGGEVVEFFGSYNLLCIRICNFFFRNNYLKLQRIWQNRDFSIIFFYINFSILFKCQNNRKKGKQKFCPGVPSWYANNVPG